MTYYLGLHPDTDNATVWTFGQQSATRVDVPQISKIVSGTPPQVVLEKQAGWTFVPLKLEPGQFYPRMARPISRYYKESPGLNPDVDETLVATGLGQLVALREQLERIFRTVHPTKDNFETYGHDLRNVILLAATEVEAHWKGVLQANGKKGESTKDYVKLLPAMKLDEYEIGFPLYPWLDPVRPFARWVPNLPTQSLSWYDAYNAVKHDREKNFKEANVLNALNAVSAVAIMMHAQFGSYSAISRREPFLQLLKAPKWDPSDIYPEPASGAKHMPKSYPFDSAES